MDTSTRSDVEKAMRDVYTRVHHEAGCKATHFARMLSEYGGQAIAQRATDRASRVRAITTLWERQRLDPTVEPRVVQPIRTTTIHWGGARRDAPAQLAWLCA